MFLRSEIDEASTTLSTSRIWDFAPGYFVISLLFVNFVDIRSLCSRYPVVIQSLSRRYSVVIQSLFSRCSTIVMQSVFLKYVSQSASMIEYIRYESDVSLWRECAESMQEDIEGCSSGKAVLHDL